MLTRDYNKASQQDFMGEFHSALWTSLEQVRLGGKWFYRRTRGYKCRQCRRANGRWTGARVCACGNPFINVSRLPQERLAGIARGRNSGGVR